ncbi:MAG: bifunctional metallophosphatase/5'-nucleotidase [Spirochaetia bacterium]
MIKVKILPCAILLSFLLSCSFSPPKKLRLIYVNDTHGRYDASIVPSIDKKSSVGGLATLGGFLAIQRKIMPDLILLDAGNAIFGTPLAYLTQGESSIDLLNTLGFDAINLGSAEFAYGIDNLKERIEVANFPVLNANIITKKSKEPLLETPFTIIERNGVRVGIIGVQGGKNFYLNARPYTTDLYTTEDENTILQYWIDEIREDVDLVVVLAHQGFTGMRTSGPFFQYENLLYKDQKMAQEVRGIDILVQGNSRIAIQKPIKVGQTLIVSAGAHSYFAGVLDLSIDTNRKKILRYKNNIYPMITQLYPPLAKTQERIEFWKKRFESALAHPIGQTTAPIGRRFYCSSALGNLVADAVFASTKGADFALVSAAILEEDLPQGPISYADLLSSLPLPYNIVQIRLSGKEILQTFKTVATLRYGILQVSDNVKAVLDYQGIDQSVQSLLINDKPINPDKIYTINVTSFGAEGGGGFISQPINYSIIPLTIQEAIQQYLAAFETYSPIEDARIQIVNVPNPARQYPHAYAPLNY